jgi:hypothetical protein
MGIVAWNYSIPDEPLKRDFLNKTGVALLIKDIKTGETPGLEAVVRSGLVAQPVEATAEAIDAAPGPAVPAG